MRPKFGLIIKINIMLIYQRSIYYVHIIINHILIKQNALNVKLKNQQNVMSVILHPVTILIN